MMKKWLPILWALVWQVAGQDALGAKRFPVETVVEVVDVQGEPLADIAVNLSYLTGVETKLPERQEAETDAGGMAGFEGKGYRRISVYIHEDGYYGHRENHEIIEFRDGEPFAVGELATRSELKEVRKPIAMLADGSFRLTIPVYDEEVGFDFMLNDWIAPYGAGDKADVLMKVTGHFQFLYRQGFNAESSIPQ